MAKTFILNGKDYTSWFARAGYTVRYEPVDGGQGGVMQDGTYTEDEIALKAAITLQCMPLNEIQLGAILTEIYSVKYVNLTYFDPKTRGTRTIQARRSASEQKYRGFGADGREYWTGTVITLKER